jgi:hypothetical protein
MPPAATILSQRLDWAVIATPLARMPSPEAHENPEDPHGFKRRGMMFVLSSPSGAGKSTIAGKLLDSNPELQVSVSYTTRPLPFHRS